LNLESRHRRANQSVVLRQIGNVGTNSNSSPTGCAYRVGSFFCGITKYIVNYYCSTFARVSLRNTPADAAAGAGHYRDFPLQPHEYLPSLAARRRACELPP
jgi:hypothetical protein